MNADMTPQKIREALDAMLNKPEERTVSFVLFMFEGTKAGYVSNGADRQQIIRSLKLLIKKLKSDATITEPQA